MDGTQQQAPLPAQRRSRPDPGQPQRAQQQQYQPPRGGRQARPEAGGRGEGPGRRQPPPQRRQPEQGGPEVAQQGPPSLSALLTTAAGSRQPAATRAAALQEVHQLLYTPAAQQQAMQQLQALWPRLLRLLWGPAPEVSAAAAPVVGAVAALAAQASAAAQAAASGASGSKGSTAAGASGGAAGLLFDWLLPVLESGATPDGEPLAGHHLSATLLALRDCLAGVDKVTLARYANAAFGACQALLEKESTPPEAVAPVCEALQQAARHQHSLRARFGDLVDLLLGWAMDPTLPDTARPVLGRTLVCFASAWQQQPALAARLLANLLSDLKQLATTGPKRAAPGGKPAPRGSASSRDEATRKLLAVAACVAAILEATGGALPDQGLVELQELLQLLTLAVQRPSARAASTGAAVSELAGHVGKLAGLATTSSSGANSSTGAGRPQAQQKQQQEVTQQAAKSRQKVLQRAQQQPEHEPRASPLEQAAGQERVVLQLSMAVQALSLGEHVSVSLALQPAAALPTLQPAAEEAQVPVPPAQSPAARMYPDAASFCAAAMRRPAVVAHPAAVSAVLTAQRRWLLLLAEQRQLPALDAAAAALLSTSPGATVPGGWLLRLRSHSSREVLQQAAQLLFLLLQHAPAAMALLLSDVTSLAVAAGAAEGGAVCSSTASTDGETAAGHDSDPDEQEAVQPIVPLLFSLQLMQTSLPQLPASSAAAVWQALLPLVLPGAPGAANTRVWAALLAVLQAAGVALLKQEDAAAAAAAAEQALVLIAKLVHDSSMPEQQLLLSLQWLRDVAPPQLPTSLAQHSCIHSALCKVAAATNADSAAVRQAALAALQALALCPAGSTLLLLGSDAAAEVWCAAVVRLSDLQPAVAAAARELLISASATLALASSASSSGGSARACAELAASRAAGAALQPQRRGFRPAQLQQLMNYLTAEGPVAVLSAGGERQDNQLHQWLPKLLHSLPAMPEAPAAAAAAAAAAAGPKTLAYEGPRMDAREVSTLSQAAWFVLQEAAKQCVAMRLSTPLGSAAQTLAGLERALQRVLARQQEQPNSAASCDARQTDEEGSAEAAEGGAPSGQHWQQQMQGVLLLHFLLVLEQGIAAAVSGSSTRAGPPRGAVAFFSANEKVCSTWFTRMRGSLLRAAAAAGQHPLAVHHGLSRLQDLESQLHKLLSAMPAPFAPGSQAFGAAVAKGSATPTSASSKVPAAGSGTQLLQQPPQESTAPEMPTPAEAMRMLQSSSTAAGTGEAAAGASPAAALLAATMGSPCVIQARTAPRPGSSKQLTQQQLLAAAAKIGEAAGAVATALCHQHDPAGIAALQTYCQQAFGPLLERLVQLGQQQHQSVGEGQSSSDAETTTTTTTTAAPPPDAAAPWAWLEAVRLHAAGRHEAALEQFGRISGSSPFLPAAAAVQLAADCYGALGLAADSEPWLCANAQQLPQGTGGQLLADALACAAELSTWGSLDASTVQHERPPAAANASRQQALLQLLQGSTLEGNSSLQQAQVSLAQLARCSEKMSSPLPELPLQMLLPWEAAVRGMSFTAWRQPNMQQGGLALGAAVQPALLLLGQASPSQRAPLLYAAASRAESAGNQHCADVLLAQASMENALALQPHLSSVEGLHSARNATQALRLLSSLAGSAGDERALIVPAAVQLLRRRPVEELAQASAQAAAALKQFQLPGHQSFEAFESQLVLQNGKGGAAAAAAVEYAALKAAAAATPGAARHWWQLAAWVQKYLMQQQSAGSSQLSAAARQGHALAIAGYCRALALASSGGSGSGNSSTTLPLLLQLLQVLARHGSQLSDHALAASLASVPAAAWLPVVPQLLSLLASGSASQALVLRVLLGVAGAAPAAVLLPALVEQRQQQEGGDGATDPTLAALVQQLQGRHPVLAQQLHALTQGCCQLAVLPEEHWHAVLLEAGAAASKALTPLQAELQALPHKQQIAADVADRYRTAAAPLLLALQQQLQAAEGAGATPHERQFMQAQLPRMHLLLEQLLVSAPLDAAGLQHPLQLLRQAATDAGAALRRRKLALAQVAPALAALLHTAIPLPGAAEGSGGWDSDGSVTIAGVAAEATVLATKTRPKKLSLLGSDGGEYAFLLKGREDLRADARVMQWLGAASSALQSSSTNAGGDGLAVHCFAVLPVASRAGLIQWVESSTPLYELYTSWQAQRAERAALLAAVAQRQHQVQAGPQGVAGQAAAPQPQQKKRRPGLLQGAQGQQAKPTKQKAAAIAPTAQAGAAQQQQQQAALHARPVDLFYARIKAAGLDPATPRDSWPLPPLRAALAALQRGVDSQLLARELWVGAAGAADWWQRQRSFASSTAAMSMVGYLLGLGDRHLDNILLHRRSGHVAHVDFSVLFDRGRQLKVPEVVPFRLTQTIAAALGPAGPEGVFLQYCRRALHALRTNAQPLGALLNAALRDPLVDWGGEAALKAAWKAYEAAVALQLFVLHHSARAAQELEAAAAAACNALAAAASGLGPYMHQFGEASAAAATAAESQAVVARCQATQAAAAERGQQLAAAAGEARATADQLLAESQPLAAEVARCLQECQQWQQRHDALLSLLVRNPPMPLVAPTASAPWSLAAATCPLGLVTVPQGSAIPTSILDAALGMPAGEAPLSSSLLVQAAAADTSGGQLLQQRAVAAGQVVEHLRQYAAAVAWLLGGARYGASSQHWQWVPALRTALEPPLPKGFERAVQLAPKPGDPAAVAHAWRSLKVAAEASSGLAQQFAATRDALQLERVDAALAAAEARQGLLEKVQEHRPDSLAQAFAAFTEREAAAAQSLCDAQAAQEGAAPQLGSAERAAQLLDSWQRQVLGYASIAVAVRDAAPEEVFTAPGGGSILQWLSEAVQATDGVSTAAAELQLLLPPLLRLLHSEEQAAAVSAAVSTAQRDTGAAEDAASEEQAAAAAMQPLLAAGGQHPALGALLQVLQRLQAAAQQLLMPDQLPSLASQQLQLASAAAELWAELVAAAGAGSSQTAAGAASHASSSWQQCSLALAGAVAAQVQRFALPALAGALGRTAHRLRTSAATVLAQSLARQQGAASAAAGQQQPEGGAAGPELVPFTDFEAGGVADEDLLLGELEMPGEEGEQEEEEGLDQAGPGGRRLGVLGLSPQPAQRQGLIPFGDFDEGLPDDLLEALEGSLEGQLEPFSAGSSQSQLSQGGGAWGERGGMLEQSHGAEGRLAAGEEQLEGRLAAACYSAGVLAATDAVAYLSGLALQQCQALAQRHGAELAAFEWMHEELLPPAALAAPPAASAVVGAPPGAAAAAAAGAGVHPAVAPWSLRSRRQQLLGDLRAAATALASLDAPLAQWQAQQLQLVAALGDELAAVMGWAAPRLQAQLSQRQAWLQAAAAHCRSLLEVVQAVLQFEASRAAAAAAPAAMPPSEPSVDAAAVPAGAAGADRYLAEQRVGWQRYAAVLACAQQLHHAHAAAERSVEVAAQELTALQQSKAGAASAMRAAEGAGGQAAARFGAAAFPLVKSTQQQLAPALKALVPALAGCAAQAKPLAAMQQQAAALAAATKAAATAASGGEGEPLQQLHQQAAAAAEQLAAAAQVLRQLPPAVRQLQGVLNPVRNRLLAGGRGEAAAREQAALVVEGLGPAVSELRVQMDVLEGVQGSLADIPARLAQLAQLAGQQAGELQRRHGFSLAGLTGVAAGAVPAAGMPGPDVAVGALPLPRAGQLGAGLLLHGAPRVGEQERCAFAAATLRSFEAKLQGGMPAGEGVPAAAAAAAAELAGEAGTAGPSGEQQAQQQQQGMIVEAQVDYLIAQATSPDRLARMFEGWMPWV